MTKRRLTALAALLMVVGLLAGCGQTIANGDVIKWDGDYTVEEGETVKGDLTLFDGDATVEDGGTIEGTIIVWNGNAEIEGTVEEDLIVSGGDIYLGDDAWVQGDVVCSWNCSIEQDGAARIDGKIVEGVVLPQVPSVPEIKAPPPMNVQVMKPGAVFGPLFNFIRNIVSAFVVAALAVLVALLLPQPVTRVGQAMTKAVVPSFGYGLLTAVAVGAAIIALALTICLSPIAILAGLVLLAASLYGWICFGTVIGERLLKAFSAQTVEPVWAAGLGTLVVSLVVAMIDAAVSVGQMIDASYGCLCCLMPLVWPTVFILGCAGLGAVVLTRFGSQSYPLTTEGAEEELVVEG